MADRMRADKDGHATLVKRNGVRTGELQGACVDARRAALRDMGPVRHTAPLPHERLGELRNTEQARLAEGPVWPGWTALLVRGSSGRSRLSPPHATPAQPTASRLTRRVSTIRCGALAYFLGVVTSAIQLDLFGMRSGAHEDAVTVTPSWRMMLAPLVPGSL